MVTSRLRQEPRRFKLLDYECHDYGELLMQPPGERTHEIVTLRNASGKSCDIAATAWGFYLGPSLNSRLKSEGFKSALMVNPKGQIFLVAVEQERMGRFQGYLADNGSRILAWLDEWSEDSVPGA